MASVVFPVHLLLLPPAPWPPSYSALNAAYSAPIASTLTKLQSGLRNTTTGSCLEIALPVPFLHQHRGKTRSELYPLVQQLVAGLYKLVCVVAAKQAINVEDAEGIDVKLILLAHSRNPDELGSQHSTGNRVFGPVIDLPTLAVSQRPWKSVFSVESEDGETLLRQFLVLQDSHVNINNVGGGVVQVATETDDTFNDTTTTRHSSVAVGGTWDHIHIGHKLLLTMTAFMLDPQAGDEEKTERSVTIGITGDELLKNKKYIELVQGWKERQNSVIAFLQAIMDFRAPRNAKIETKQLNNSGPNGHAIHTKIAGGVTLRGVEINDPFGPTITDETISALVVSGETRSGGKAVNDKRTEKGWSALEVLEVDVLDAQDTAADVPGQGDEANAFQSKLSSTSIRKAIRDRGRLRSKA